MTTTTLTDPQIVTRSPSVSQSRPDRTRSLTITAPDGTAIRSLIRALESILRGHDGARLVGNPTGVNELRILSGDHCLVVIHSGMNTRLSLPHTYLKHDLARPVDLVFPGIERSAAVELIHRLLSRPAAAVEACRALVPISHYRVLQNEYRQTWLKLAVADFLSYAAKRHSSAPRVQVFDLDDTRQGVTYPSFALF